jgi:hypothetical protein
VGHGYPVYYDGRASDGRMPFLSQTDLYVQHEIKMANRRLQFSCRETIRLRCSRASA